MTTAVACLVRAGVFGLLWAVLSGFDPDYAVYGVVSVALVTWLSIVLLPPRTTSLAGLAGLGTRVAGVFSLVVWFLGQVGAGGVDVALRAVKPRVDIDPTTVQAPQRLPEGHGRALSLLLMNLMPGSLVQSLSDDGDTVTLHTLSPELDPEAQWRGLQERVARASGLNLDDEDSRS